MQTDQLRGANAAGVTHFFLAEGSNQKSLKLFVKKFRMTIRCL